MKRYQCAYIKGFFLYNRDLVVGEGGGSALKLKCAKIGTRYYFFGYCGL